MTDPVRQYLEAKKRYDSASAQASKMITLVRNVGQALTAAPLSFSFANCGESMPAEAVLVYRAGGSPDANHWPTAVQIHERLKAVHSAKSELESAWSRLSADDKSGLQAPQRQFVPT